MKLIPLLGSVFDVKGVNIKCQYMARIRPHEPYMSYHKRYQETTKKWPIVAEVRLLCHTAVKSNTDKYLVPCVNNKRYCFFLYFLFFFVYSEDMEYVAEGIALSYVCRILKLHSCLFAQLYHRASISGVSIFHWHLFASHGNYDLLPENWDCTAIYVQNGEIAVGCICKNTKTTLLSICKTMRIILLHIGKTVRPHCYLFAKHWNYTAFYLQNTENALLYICKTERLHCYSSAKQWFYTVITSAK